MADDIFADLAQAAEEAMAPPPEVAPLVPPTSGNIFEDMANSMDGGDGPTPQDVKPGVVEDLTDYYNGIQNIKPVDTDFLTKTLYQTITDPKRSDAAVVMEVWDGLARAKIISPSNLVTPYDTAWMDSLDRESDGLVDALLQEKGLDARSMGAANFKDKQILRRQAKVAVALSRAPIDEGTIAHLTKNVVLAMYDRRIAEVGTEAEALKKPLDEVNMLKALRQRLDTVTPNDWLHAYRHMLVDTSTRPVNSQESQMLEREEGVFWLRQNQGLQIKPGGPALPGEIYGILHQAFGDAASSTLLGEIHRNKRRFVMEKLGYLKTTDGKVITGTRTDDDNFLAIAPTGAMERIVARINLGDPKFVKELKSVEAAHGKDAAMDFLFESTLGGIDSVIKPLAEAITQPPPADLPPTEAQVSLIPSYYRAGYVTLDILQQIGHLGKSVFQNGDQALNRSTFIRNQITRRLASTLGGDDEYVNREVNDLAGALHHIFMVDFSLATKNLSELRMKADQLGYAKWQTGKTPSKEEFFPQDLSQGTMKAGVGAGVVAHVKESFPRMYAQVDKNNEILGAFMNGTRDPKQPGPGLLEAAQAAMMNTAYGAFGGTMEMVGTVMDDPNEVGTFFAQGLAMTPAVKIASGWASRAAGRVAYTWRLRADLKNLVAHHPEEMGRFMKATKEALDKATPGGKEVKVLNDVVAQLEVFEQRRKVSGVLKDAGPVARTLQRAWPEIRDGLGTLGHTLGSPLLKRGRFSTILQALTRKVGSTPTQGIEAVLGNMRTSDQAIIMLQDALGARGIADEIATARRNFAAENGRAPTTQELVDLSPKPVQDVYNLMVTAEKNGLRQPLSQKILGKIFGQDYLETATSAERLMNDWLQATTELVERTRALGVVRERSTIVLDTAKAKAQAAIDVLELELDYVKRNKMRDPEAPLFDQRIKAIQDEIQARLGHIRRFEVEGDALWRHDASKPWSFSNDVKEMLYGKDGYVDASSTAMMMDLYPDLFQGLPGDVLFFTKRSPIPKDQVAAWDAGARKWADWVRQSRKEWKAAEKNPALVDKELKDLQAEVGRLTEKKAQLKKAQKETDFISESAVASQDNILLQRVEADLQRVGHDMLTRKKALDDGSWTSATVEKLKADHEAAVQGRKAYVERRNRLQEQGVINERTVHEPALEAVRSMFDHDGMGANEKILRSMGHKLHSLQSAQFLGVGANPFLWELGPAWYKGELLHQTIRASGWRAAAALEQSERLAAVARKFTPAERDAYVRLLREGGDTAALEGLPAESAAKLSKYFELESGAYRLVWQILDDTGSIPKSVIENWKNNRYDPRLSGMRMRMNAARGAEAEGMLGKGRNLPANPELDAFGMDWGEFSFRREVGKWRARIQQSDVIVDRLFETEEAMNKWLTDQYGPDWKKDLGGFDDQGVARGRTIYGENLGIGKPISELEMKINDPIMGPEARNINLRKALKDAHLHLINEALNVNGDMIIPAQEYLNSPKATNVSINRNYVKIPDTDAAKIAYGNLAGKYVHRSVLREMGQGAKVYDSLQALADGWREIMELNDKESRSIMNALGMTASKATRRFRAGMSVLKDNLIIKSVRTWFANAAFWVYSDHIAGTNVFSAEGLPRLVDRLLQYREARSMSVAEDGLIQRARAQGIVGGLFEQDALAFSDMTRKVLGLENRGSIEVLLAKREALFTELRAKKLELGVGEETLGKIQREILNIKLLLENENKSLATRSLKKVWGLFSSGRDVAGKPLNRTYHRIRGFYNWMDSAYKLEQFRQLTTRMGMDDITAGNVVRLFSQDYGNLPSAIRQANPWVFSLVPAFPYEAGRIAFNAMAHRPGRFVSMMTALPAMNIMNFAAAGIDVNRALAMIAARGKTDKTQAVLSLFNTIYLTDPSEGNITDEVSLNGVFPWAGLAQSRGVLTRMYDNTFPPEQRGLVGQLGALGVNVASNFFFSNPAYNIVGALTFNQDMLTGERITAKEDDVWHNLKAYARTIGKQVLPPIGPGGRDWDAIERASNGTYSPKTGKPFKVDQEITAYLRGATGITWRGKTAQELANTLGLDTHAPHPLVDDDDLIMSSVYRNAAALGNQFGDNKIPTMGEYNELRELIYKSVDNALTPEQKVEAEKAAKQLFRDMHRAELEGLKDATTATERQYRLWKNKVLEDGVISMFSTQNVLVQAAVLVQLDTQGLRDKRIQDLAWAMERTDLGAIRSPPDPAMVDKAVELLDYRIRTGGKWVNPRLKDIREWIAVVQKTRAERKYLREEAREPLNEVRKEIWRQ